MKYTAKNLAKTLSRLARKNAGKERELAKSFVDFCKAKRLEYILPSFLRYLKTECKRDDDTKNLRIFSASKLTDEIVKSIKKMVGTQIDAKIEAFEDKKIIAGFIAYYQNKIIDASLENNLHVLKNRIIA